MTGWREDKMADLFLDNSISSYNRKALAIKIL